MVEERVESLGAPDPICQFCEMAVSYVKVHHQAPSYPPMHCLYCHQMHQLLPSRAPCMCLHILEARQSRAHAKACTLRGAECEATSDLCMGASAGWQSAHTFAGMAAVASADLVGAPSPIRCTVHVQIALANHETQEQIIAQLDTVCDTLAIFSSSQALVECDAIPSMPPVSFKIGGKDFTLAAEDYVLQVRRLASCTPPPERCTPPTSCCTHARMIEEPRCRRCLPRGSACYPRGGFLPWSRRGCLPGGSAAFTPRHLPVLHCMVL